MEITEATKIKLKRVHQKQCGTPGLGRYDSFADVLEACERKIAQWEREGVLTPYRSVRPNDWLFAGEKKESVDGPLRA